MRQYLALVLMVRFVMPTSLLLSIALRPFGLSILYLLLYLILPLSQLTHRKKGWRSYIFFSVIMSFLLLMAHVAWHCTLASFEPYGSLLDEHPLIKEIGESIGLVAYNRVNSLTAIVYIMPEMIMVTVSLILHIAITKMMAETGLPIELDHTVFRKHPIMVTAGKYACLFLCMLSGIFSPSIISGIYYLVFIACATFWSLGKLSDRVFAVVGRCIMAIMAVHCVLIMVYQVPRISEDMYAPDRELSRYFGLAKLVNISRAEPEFTYQVTYDHKWTHLLNPLVILITYYVLALTTRSLLKPKQKRVEATVSVGKPNGNLMGHPVKKDEEKWLKATKRVKVAFPYLSSKVLQGRYADSKPLLQHQSTQDIPMKSFQDSSGSIVIPEIETVTEVPEHKPNWKDEVLTAVVDFFQVLIRSSYIVTTITMMAWSIMFHSWLTFVFLMWANIVWLRQDQRSFMLRTSPILVLYAIVLLIIQYIYGMNLTDDELPNKFLATHVNLRQIGIFRPSGEPFVPLLIKTLFTCTFWITLRQWVQEIGEQRKAKSPFASPHTESQKPKPSRILTCVGGWLRIFCARYWIYVVVIMLFVIGITGERMTIFRITYMALFLWFILMFQYAREEKQLVHSMFFFRSQSSMEADWEILPPMKSFLIIDFIGGIGVFDSISWYWWRRFMYTFWIIVIVYSMINLILIYVYQFDNFSRLIEDYLLINPQLQNDLGLEPYHPADLFVKLLTPTCFLIITIMQVHYFHKDFMNLSDPVTRTNSIRDIANSKPTGASTAKDEALESEETRPQSKVDDAKSLMVDTEISSFNTMKRKQSRYSESGITERPSTAIRSYFTKFLRTAKETILGYMNKICLYLEIHLIKIIFFSIMMLCVMNVCALHVPLIFIISLALLFKTKKQKAMILFISTTISIYLMAKMVYQIQYINHSYFDVNCTWRGENNSVSVTTYNSAEWLGFTKASKNNPLVSVLKGYIGLIAAFVFYSLIGYRQQVYRKLGILPRNKDKVIFPNITRQHADKDMLHCMKYLVNYCFYKFGVEITLISLIAVIGSRMDVYSVFYSFWLLVLVAMKRERQAAVWPAFTACIVILVPIQYLLALGFVPRFCLVYPWDGVDTQIKNARTWLFLPFPNAPPKAVKLVFDYVLLLMASRQMRVFTIEKKVGDSYPGGSNKDDVGENWETPEFVNPVPDFLISIGTWLDVVKRAIFLGMLWVTLAIMFLTGTNRVNLFSMGYLIGSFIFLWQGTDFYLRPKETILQWWSWLLYYNVSVVVIKTLLQIPGCIFSAMLQEHACWLVQLLGIGCVDKFSGGNIAHFIKMHYVKEATCSVPQEDIGLAWDGVCFAFLILQRRLFHSYYFYRVIDESKATTMLASRGAELIEELRLKQMKVQENQEVKILEKIKIKMERIKANQKKIQGVVCKEAPHHDAEDEDEDYTQPEETERVPLMRTDTDGSGRGYHTPQSPASPKGFHTPISEPSAPPSPSHMSHPINPLPPLPILPPTSSIGGPPSPSSALMTHSLDAYLEPRRISFESPPNSELIQRAQTPEESYPVFSPPPIRRRHTVASPSVMHRTSIISQSSRGDRSSHHASSERPKIVQPTSHQQAVRSGDYYMFDEFDDTDLPLKDEEEEFPKDLGISHLLVKVFMDSKNQEVLQRRRSAPVVAMTSDRPVLSDHPYSDPNQYRSTDGLRDASTSEKDQDMPLSEIGNVEEKETWIDKILRVLQVLCNLIKGLTLTLAIYLMRFSRDYRYVSRTLSYEKKCLKEKEGFGIGLREGTHMIWEPLPNTLIRGTQDSRGPAQDDSMFDSGRSVFVQFSYAFWYAVLAHTDVVCYIMVFINQIQSATILSIPLPLMVFLWGTLSIPRPTKTFWVTLIAYTEVIVLIKSMFQFEILPWNQKAVPANTPFTAPRIIGIERKHNYALYDLLLLLIIFLHRFMLKSLGLWKESTPDFELHEDKDYRPTAHDTQLIMEGRRQEVGKKYLKIHSKTGAGHHLVDRYYHVQATIEYVVRKLQARRSDPRIAQFVGSRFQEITRRKTAIHDQPNLRRVLNAFIEENLSRGMGSSNSLPPLTLNMSEESNISGVIPGGITAGLTAGIAAGVARDYGAGPSQPNEEDGDEDAASVLSYSRPIISVTTTQENQYRHYPALICLSMKRYFRPTKRFFEKMLEPGARVTADIYAYMFLCDFFNFLVVIFGFAAFGTHQGDGGVQAYLEENKVPIPFLVMLILQFVLIIVDRALYLRKFMLGKILFQYALIVGVHIWMFFVLPFITERTFNNLLPPPMWYMVKCIYLLLSAYQIRCGYPRRIIGNFLCKSYTFLNMLLFRGFMAVPFLFELRTLMDWIWTDTSMTLLDWLKMEDIFASVFLLKCSRYMESEFPQPRGAKKSSTSKYILGGVVLSFVIAIIWFPLVFFAFGNSVGEPNPPVDVTVKIRIGPFLPVYQMSAQSHNIDVFTESDYSQLSNLYARDRTAQTFLSNYMFNDVAVITINPNSTMKWEISPPELARLEKEAASKSPLTVKFTYIVTHLSNTAQNPPTMEDSREVTLQANVGDSRNPERKKLYNMLIGTADSETWLNVKTLFPKFVKVFNKGQLKPASQLTPTVLPSDDPVYDEDSKFYRDVQLRLERQGDAMYWRVREFCHNKDPLIAVPMNNCDMLIMYTFNDKLFPETLNLISGSGIIGLYTTFVFLAARVLRGFFSGIYTKIMFDDLPNADRVLQLCLDIYLVREALELSLEEDLFAKLVFLYRSPETMIKWSRPKEEEEPRPIENNPQE